MLAMQNIETLDGMGVRKIITQCPHCFNTLKNEYPQLGGNYEVVHHSQFLEWLIDHRQARHDRGHARRAHRVPRQLLPRPPQRRLPGPRKVLGSLKGIEIVEASAQRHQGHVLRRRRRPHVHGGDIGTKVNDERSEQLLETGASRVATACPFCYIMIDDGVKAAWARTKRSRWPTSPCTCSRRSNHHAGDEPGRRVDQQPESSERRLAFDAPDQIVGQRDAFGGRAENEFAGVQQEDAVGVDLDQFGEVGEVFLDVDHGTRVVPEHEEPVVEREVHR
jgi:Fe-S oxidoreductase